jgi:hypothetical protein
VDHQRSLYLRQVNVSLEHPSGVDRLLTSVRYLITCKAGEALLRVGYSVILAHGPGFRWPLATVAIGLRAVRPTLPAASLLATGRPKGSVIAASTNDVTHDLLLSQSPIDTGIHRGSRHALIQELVGLLTIGLNASERWGPQ